MLHVCFFFTQSNLKLLHVQKLIIHSFLFLSSSLYMDILQMLVHSLVDGHSQYFQVFYFFKKKSSMNICVYVFVCILSSWITIHPRVEWLGHIVCVCLTLETAELFPRVIVPVYFLLALWKFRSVSPHPFQYLLWSVFLRSCILIGAYCIVIVICICLMTNDIECLFKCLFAVCVSLVSWFFTSLPILKRSSLASYWILRVLYGYKFFVLCGLQILHCVACLYSLNSVFQSETLNLIPFWFLKISSLEGFLLHYLLWSFICSVLSSLVVVSWSSLFWIFAVFCCFIFWVALTDLHHFSLVFSSFWNSIRFWSSLV